MTLRLTPPEMGTVRIHLEVQGATVRAQFHAETEPARQLLQQQLTHLRQGLENQGLAVERLTVQAMQPTSHAPHHHAHADASPQDGRSRGEYNGQPHGQGQSDGDRHPQQDDAPRQRWRRFQQVLNEMA